jgi:hypothetical protein
MPYLLLHVMCSFLLDLAHVLTRSDHDQALEFVLLRQQLRLCERQATKLRLSRWEKVVHASLAAGPPALPQVCLVLTSVTLLRRHRPGPRPQGQLSCCPGATGLPWRGATGDTQASGAGTPRRRALRRKWSSEWSSGPVPEPRVDPQPLFTGAPDQGCATTGAGHGRAGQAGVPRPRAPGLTSPATGGTTESGGSGQRVPWQHATRPRYREPIFSLSSRYLGGRTTSERPERAPRIIAVALRGRHEARWRRRYSATPRKTSNSAAFASKPTPGASGSRTWPSSTAMPSAKPPKGWKTPG